MKIPENVIERDIVAMSSLGKARSITHLCFYMNDYDSIQTINYFSKIRGIVAVVDKEFFLKNHCLDDRHINYNLPADISNLLGGELMESHFEVLEPMKTFFAKLDKTGMLYMGTHHRLQYFQRKKLQKIIS